MVFPQPPISLRLGLSARQDLWREGTEVTEVPLAVRTDFHDSRFPNEYDRLACSTAPLKW